MFELHNIENAAIPREYLNVLSWQRQKRSCETSSIFEVGHIKNEAILGNFLQ